MRISMMTSRRSMSMKLRMQPVGVHPLLSRSDHTTIFDLQDIVMLHMLCLQMICSAVIGAHATRKSSLTPRVRFGCHALSVTSVKVC